MAGKTTSGLVEVVLNLTVVVVHVRLVVLVAGETGEIRRVGTVSVTLGTGRPFAVMFPGEDWEVVSVVVERGPSPGCDHMATQAGSRESGRTGMLTLEVTLMASQAVLWGRGIEEGFRSSGDMAAGAGKGAVVPHQIETSAEGPMVC